MFKVLRMEQQDRLEEEKKIFKNARENALGSS